MPTVLSELEKKILNRVVHQFLDFKKTTQRRELLREFESPGATDKLASIGMLQATAATNYLPSGIAFYYCNDPEVQALTRRGVRAVAYVLKNLIKEVSPNLERSNIERLAREFDKDADEKVIRAGLYVASELGLFQSSRGKNDEEVDVIPLRINQYIYEKDPQSLWDELIRRYEASAKHLVWLRHKSIENRSEQRCHNNPGSERIRRKRQASRTPPGRRSCKQRFRPPQPSARLLPFSDDSQNF